MMQSLEVWFAGPFAHIQVGRYEYLWAIVLITAVIFIYADKLTLASLGETVSTNLGLNYKVIVLLGTVLISFTVGLVSVVVGNLPFLGLMVPNLISMLRGDDFWTLLSGKNQNVDLMF